MTNQAPPRTDVASLTYGDRSVDLPVVHGTEDEVAADISKLRGDTGLITLDVGYGNTGATRSAITFLDGEQGILRYRGYPIEELAESSTFLEVAYLLIYGELPTRAAARRTSWPRSRITPSSARRCATSSTRSRTTRTRWRCSPPARWG